MRLLVLAIALAGVSVVSQVSDFVCFYITPDVPQAFDRARAVFVGEVVEIAEPLTTKPDAPLADRFHRITFKVEYSWKGAGFREFVVTELVVLSNQGGGHSCFSWGSFSEGGKYLVYADETAEKDLVVQPGKRTASLSGASEDLKELEKMSRRFFKFQFKIVPHVEAATSIECITRPCG